MIYKGVIIGSKQFATLMDTLIAEYDKKFVACQLGVNIKLSHEEAQNSSIGFLFVNCPGNDLVRQRNSLLHAWLRNPSLRNSVYYLGPDSFSWDVLQANTLLQLEHEAFSCLLIAMLTSGGGSPQGSEVAAMTAGNLPNSLLHVLQLIMGVLGTLAQYNKTTANTNQLKVIARIPTQAVRHQLCIHLAVDCLATHRLVETMGKPKQVVASYKYMLWLSLNPNWKELAGNNISSLLEIGWSSADWFL
jgi:hypothetical protein